MAWLFQGVLNAGLQILLSIFGGWLCAWMKLVDPEVMSRNVNAFAMKAAYPAFIIHLLGIKTNLRDQEAWRALGVFVLWVLLIHMACFIFHKLRGKQSNVLQLGLNCLLLTTNNTGCIGWPVLIATVGQQSAVLSMLLGVLFFIQLLPVTICCFEYHKWQQTEGQQGITTRACNSQADDVHRGDQLPTTQDEDKQQLLALPAPTTAFPHEFRYCYWSNELYRPARAQLYMQLHGSGGIGRQGTAPGSTALVEVCVESGDEDDEAAGHHCFGGGNMRTASRTSTDSNMDGAERHSSNTVGSISSSSSSSSRPSHSGREWWRTGRPKPQGGLKRAKDSCDSLYTPFAAAAVAAKQKEVEQQQRPSTLGLSSLTKRLSRGLSAAGAAAAAAAGAAAAAATPSSLVRAVSLHTASSLKKTPSLKPAASLRRQAAARDPLCQLNAPLIEPSGEARSCCPSHRTTSPRCSSRDVDESAAAAAAAGISNAAAADKASGRPSDSSSRGCSSQGGGSIDYTSSSDGGSSSDAAAPAATARLSRLPGMVGPQLAADSAVELHVMCESLMDAAAKPHQQQRQLGGKDGAARASAAADNAALGLPSTGSATGLHTLTGDDMCGRINSDTGRVSSRTNLLPCGAVGGVSLKGSSKLGAAPAAARASSGSAGVQGGKAKEQQQGQQRRQTIFGRFVNHHPLLCRIVAGQMQSFHLWLNVVAIALSVSGARKYLDPLSPEAIPALGFVDGVLSWFSAACIPTLLFANGVWMCGKDILCGGWRGQLKVMSILLLKLTLLPALMVGLTQLCNIRGEYGLSLVLLASCPLAPLAFLVCQQYGFGAELGTSITIQGVLLMLPQMMAVISVNQLGGLYDVELMGT